MQGTTAPLFKDTTRKVNLFWVLEHTSQDRWVKDKLKALQRLDSGKVGQPLSGHG